MPHWMARWTQEDPLLIHDSMTVSEYIKAFYTPHIHSGRESPYQSNHQVRFAMVSDL